jgi:hypothetical protein
MTYLNISRRRLACGLMAVLLSGATTAAAQAEPGEQAMAGPGKNLSGFTLTYDVYSGGFRALRLDLALGFDAENGTAPASYDTRIRMETSGLVGALFNWRFHASSVGAWQNGEAVPVRYHTANVWRGNARQVEIAYEDGIAGAVRAEPPYSAEDMAKVAPYVTPGVVDPTTAVTSLVMKSALEGQCRPQTAIYDGRRRYDANMQALPPRTIERSSFAPFEGQVEGCKLTFTRIAGFRPDRKRMQDLEIDIWLSEIGVAAGRVPVRLELQTPCGAGFAHLVAVRDADGALVFGEDEPD